MNTGINYECHKLPANLASRQRMRMRRDTTGTAYRQI